MTNPAGTNLSIGQGTNMTVGGGLTNNGITTVNGTLTGDLINNASGLVEGTGTITGAFTNSGTVNPGNSPGTLTVGTSAANAGSTQIVQIASASSYDKIITTAAGGGGGTLNGGTYPQNSGRFLPSTNQVFNIIQTTGWRDRDETRLPARQTRVGASRTLFWQLNYPTSVDLQAVGDYSPAGSRPVTAISGPWRTP